MGRILKIKRDIGKNFEDLERNIDKNFGDP